MLRNRKITALIGVGVLVATGAIAVVIVNAGEDSIPGAESCSNATKLSEQECGFVLRVAHKQANTSATGRRPSRQHPEAWPRTIRIVAVSAQDGTVTDPNVGAACTSGRILSVQLIGTFDILVSPNAVRAGHKPPPTTVHGVHVDIDSGTGEACLLGVQTGRVRVPDGATILYRRPRA